MEIRAIGIIVSVLFGMIVFFLYSLREAIRDRFKNIEDEVKDVRNSLETHKDTVPNKYLRIEEYVRVMAEFNSKLDRLEGFFMRGER